MSSFGLSLVDYTKNMNDTRREGTTIEWLWLFYTYYYISYISTQSLFCHFSESKHYIVYRPPFDPNSSSPSPISPWVDLKKIQGTLMKWAEEHEIKIHLE